MIIQDKMGTHLQIFENFRIDRNLPKHWTEKDESDEGMSEDSFFTIGEISTDDITFYKVPPSSESNEGSWIRRAIRGLFKNQSSDEEPVELEPMTVQPDIFFRRVKGATEPLSFYKERMIAYASMLEQARAMGQVALAEKLQSRVDVVMYESQLLASGYPKFLREESIVKFAENVDQGVRLDWIKNFVRMIPQEVVKKKSELDEMRIFDNYVVLHYDPDGNATEWTREEVERARDPILFGVIKGSRRLYYVADWEDDYCNLTLDQLAEKVEVGEIPIDPMEEVNA